jgi:hypothetical protein
MPSLNRKTVLKGVSDKRQSHHDAHILINRSNIYWHDTSPQLKLGELSLLSIARGAGPNLDLPQPKI